MHETGAPVAPAAHEVRANRVLRVPRPAQSPRQAIIYDKPSVAGLEHHLTLLIGALTVTVEDETCHLQPGDCLRYRLFGATRFETARAAASYLLALS